jgi:uncharacterized protein YciI
MPLPRLARIGFGLLALLLLAPIAARAADTPATTPAAAPKKHFLYILKLIPRLHAESAWTKADEEAVGRHFRHLKAAVERGQVVLAGKTDEPGDKTFGLVIFEAADEATAKAFMESDPAVVAGVMTAELRAYHLALLRKG